MTTENKPTNKTRFTGKCPKCGAELDIENHFIHNFCPYCGVTLKHNKEDFD